MSILCLRPWIALSATVDAAPRAAANVWNHPSTSVLAQTEVPRKGGAAAGDRPGVLQWLTVDHDLSSGRFTVFKPEPAPHKCVRPDSLFTPEQAGSVGQR
jgi:hypothetical protein